VTEVLATPATCSRINVMYAATEKHITILTVGNCLRQTLNCSFILVFTLVQSRTHVDTVQNVLHGVTNSRHICWSQTMKVLGWHVTFVRRSSPTVLTLRNIYVDMKVWSRMFAVNVQSVSVQQLNWKLISWYTWTTNRFAVVHVVNISHVTILWKVILEDVLICWDLIMFNLLVCSYVVFVCCLTLCLSDCVWFRCIDTVDRVCDHVFDGLVVLLCRTVRSQIFLAHLLLSL